MEGASPQVKSSPIVRWGGAFLLVAVAAALIAVVAQSDDHSEHSAAVPVSSDAQAAPPAAPANDEGPPLSAEQTALAYSDYVGKLQVLFLTGSGVSQMYVSKIQQDIRFLNQDRMDADAEALMTAAKELQTSIDSASTPLNITDEAGAQFESVQDAASTLAAEIVGLSADLAVLAHTGMSDDKETRADMAAVKKARRDFETAVYAAYKNLGVPRAKVNPATLTLKQ